MDGIAEASEWYIKAAEASPEKGQICSACSTSMICLSDMLDYMLAVIKKTEVPKLEDEIENWKKKLVLCAETYEGKPKGEAFIDSLEKLMACIKNLEGYKTSRIHRDERAFEKCVIELREVAKNIEGPLQKIIEDSAEKMDMCRREHKLYSDIVIGSSYNYTSEPHPFIKVLKLILEHPIIATIIGGIAVILIQKRYLS